MEAIKIVLASKLLGAVDLAARRARVSRSALIRDALREHLRRIEIREMERLERESYIRQPQDLAETEAWERVASWPSE